MLTAVAKPSLSARLAWVLRLTAMGFRRHLGATVVTSGALALVALTLVTGLAWRAEAPVSSAATATATDAADAAGTAELVAFLRDDLPIAAREALADALGRLPGVAGVRSLGGDEALARMRAELGARASVLDGVEEGFLPGTLEIALGAGADGAGRADAIAWRLRRMDGITDVDVLRGAADERIARVTTLARRDRRVALGLGAMVALGALGLAVRAARRGRDEVHLLAGLGFTGPAIAAPASIGGALAGLVGGALAAGGAFIAFRFGWLAVSATPSVVGAGVFDARTLGALVAGTVAMGAVIGWWGARGGRRDEDLATSG